MSLSYSGSAQDVEKPREGELKERHHLGIDQWALLRRSLEVNYELRFGEGHYAFTAAAGYGLGDAGHSKGIVTDLSVGRTAAVGFRYHFSPWTKTSYYLGGTARFWRRRSVQEACGGVDCKKVPDSEDHFGGYATIGANHYFTDHVGFFGNLNLGLWDRTHAGRNFSLHSYLSLGAMITF